MHVHKYTNKVNTMLERTKIKPEQTQQENNNQNGRVAKLQRTSNIQRKAQPLTIIGSKTGKTNCPETFVFNPILL